MHARSFGPAVGRANLFGGEWRAARSGACYEVRAALAPFERLGSWPSSGADDVRPALDALSGGAEAWLKLGRDERAARLARAARALSEDQGAWEDLGRRLGLRLEELETERRALRSFSVPEQDDRSVSRERAVALAASDWSELFSGCFARVALELARGRSVCLLADARLPVVVDRVAQACLEGKVLSAAIAVLHAPSPEALECALGDARVTALSASGRRERIAWLQERASARGGIEVRLDVLGSAARSFDAGEDLARAAEDVIEKAFARSTTLSGQRTGQIRSVSCPERVFSRFTEALLEKLAASEAALDPLPLIDRDALERVRAHWASGLDEGATLIFGGKERSLQEVGSDQSVLPTVFTNVEPSMSVASRQDPSPVLCLIRSSAGRS